MKFYDTSSLLLIEEQELNHFLISSITLKELENIKTTINKDFSIKAKARKIINFLIQNPNNYEIIIFQNSMLQPIEEKDLEINNDMKILSCALAAKEKYPELIFITNDGCLEAIADLFLQTQRYIPPQEKYTGYKEVILTDEEMAYLYSNLKDNKYNLYLNEYLQIKNAAGELVDIMRWTENGLKSLSYHTFDSKWFGDVKPIKEDIYQAMAADSLCHNQITMLKGHAGTGKSYLALGYLFHLLDKGKIDKIIVFCNVVGAKDAARLGFLPGTRDEKILDSQTGNMLISKLGDRCEVERLIDEGRIVLLPLGDIRGYDTTGMRAGIWISEAQNLNINLIKLALQRIGEDSICIIDGDADTQVDLAAYEGNNNGMRRVSQVFKGEDIYGEIELKIIHRSKIANIAEKL